MDLPDDLSPEDWGRLYVELTAEVRAEVAASRRQRQRRRAAYLFVVVMGAFGLFEVRDLQIDQHAQIERDAVTSCRMGNETRETIRRLAKDASLEVGESIIEVASQGTDTPSDETISQFREIMARRLDTIVGQLEDRECPP